MDKAPATTDHQAAAPAAPVEQASEAATAEYYHRLKANEETAQLFNVYFNRFIIPQLDEMRRFLRALCERMNISYEEAAAEGAEIEKQLLMPGTPTFEKAKAGNMLEKDLDKEMGEEEEPEAH